MLCPLEREDGMPWLFLCGSVIGAWLTYNAYRPIFASPQGSAISFFVGWLTTELAIHHIAWQVLVTLAFVWLGALAGVVGWLALAITAISWVALFRCYWRAHDAEIAVDEALRCGLGNDYRDKIRPDISAKFAPGVDWRQILLPFPMRHPEVERVRNISFATVDGLDLKLDVYRHRSQPHGCPTLLQIHGGAWILGSKNEQGIPLMLHLAARGWVCVSADYRLSPRATFPDHLIDVKRAIRWIRERGAEYGADPNFLVVTGGSAGGHLSALAALTANEPEYQPGFELVDTSVRGCVAFYGVYDFTNRHGVYRHGGMLRLLERQVMKAPLQAAREAYEKASPLSRIHPAAPPFFVIHGDRDTLVPVGEARHFVELLRKTSGAPVVYAEVPGAQHAFEIFPSLRSAFVIHGVERFLAYLYGDYLRGRRAAAQETEFARAG
jgi:acetyl esterase/lipase